MNISVVVPCYNEGINIETVYDNIARNLNGVVDDFEIIFVNDGSNDNTKEEICSLQKRDTHVKGVHLETNSGYGFSVRAGIDRAQYEYIFYIDGDGQYDFSEYKKILSFLAAGYDFACGAREKNERSSADGPFRVILACLGTVIGKILFGVSLKDINCGFKGFRKECFSRLELNSNSSVTFGIELYLKAIRNNLKIKQVSVKHFKRMFGYSKGINFKQYQLAFFDVAKNLKDWIEMVKLI